MAREVIDEMRDQIFMNMIRGSGTLYDNDMARMMELGDIEGVEKRLQYFANRSNQALKKDAELVLNWFRPPARN